MSASGEAGGANMVNLVRPGVISMEALLVSTGIVALAEIGDKTQLLAFILATRFRKPVPIILGILAATIANHALAGALGTWLTSLLGPQSLRLVLGLSFLAIAVWVLIPDRLDDDGVATARRGVFTTTLVTFFLAEIGDKTQIATIALAARYQALVVVVIGTTLGMMIANVPAVFAGERIADRIPLRLVRGAAASLFAVLGVAALLGAGSGLGL
jgi:putative Ca2+/H+ antiporter (TMEM165/GDT1 family)